MSERWTVERVMAAAPDSASAVAGRKLAGPGPWSEVGSDGPVIWGRCRGSSREPYRVVIDTAGPRYQCTCPSRKFPCKHALALLFQWAEGRFPEDSDRPEYATAAPARQAPIEGVPEPPDPAKAAAAAARAAEREERVAAGLAELHRWIIDTVTAGLGRLAADTDQFEQQAARMIDAQAPGVARWLRRLLAHPSGGPEWSATVLAELALLQLLINAFDRRAQLDADLLATVRTHVGFTVAKADVLAAPSVSDRWLVVGLHDTDDDERVATRRVWLFGRETQRCAVVLFFSVNGAPYEMTVAPGMEIDADLHFYPGRPALRALVGNRRAEHDRALGLTIPGGTIATARDSWSAAIAADPWLGLWPIVLRGRLTVVDEVRGVAFRIIDREGAALAVLGPESLLWQAMALSGGLEFTWFGELSAQGFTPLAGTDPVLSAGELVVL